MAGITRERVIDTLVPFLAQIKLIQRGKKVEGAVLTLAEAVMTPVFACLGYALMQTTEIGPLLAASIPLGIYAISRLTFAIVTENGPESDNR